MIRLARGAEPAILSANKQRWTDEFKSGIDRRRYAHNDIKQALRTDAHEKCAYCESRVEHVSWPNVEHIVPKSREPDLVCDWDNLTIACEVCNTKKGDYYEPDCMIVHPFDDDPSEHIGWAGPMAIARSNDRGRATITTIDLNRSALLFERSQHFKVVFDLLDLISNNSGPVARAAQIDLDAYLAADSPYSAATGRFVVSQTSGTEAS